VNHRQSGETVGEDVGGLDGPLFFGVPLSRPRPPHSLSLGGPSLRSEPLPATSAQLAVDRLAGVAAAGVPAAGSAGRRLPGGASMLPFPPAALTVGVGGVVRWHVECFAGSALAGRGVDLGKICQGQIEILRFLKNEVKLGSSGWPGWMVAKPMKLGLHSHVFSINYPFFGRLVSDLVVVIN